MILNIINSIQEGVSYYWLTQPTAIHASASGIESVECVRMEIAPDGTILPIEDSQFLIECDIVIPAIGQSPLLDMLRQYRGISLERGRVMVDRETGQTTNPKYFAGGDCVNGGREVVDAVADGKRAGLAIAKLLEGAHV